MPPTSILSDNKYHPQVKSFILLCLLRDSSWAGEHNYEFVDNAIFDGFNQVIGGIIEEDRADYGLLLSRRTKHQCFQKPDVE